MGGLMMSVHTWFPKRKRIHYNLNKIMNIIKVENGKGIIASAHSLELKAERNQNTNKAIIVILSDEDIENDNTLIKLRGYDIDALIVPKKRKYTFNETAYFEKLKPQLNKGNYISYY